MRTVTPPWLFEGITLYLRSTMRHVPRLVALLAVVAATLISPAGPANAAAPSSASASAVSPTWGTYQAVAPNRVLDTRVGKGAPMAPIMSGGTVNLSVLGTAGVPDSGVSAVVLNLTITGATKPGYLTVYPAGSIRPTASSINFVAGTDRANMVTAPLGTLGTGAGVIAIYNPIGSVQVIADIMGYYLADGATTAGGFYQDTGAQRMMDTRDPAFGAPLALAPGKAVSVPVNYSDPFVDGNPHVRALAVNITAVSPTRAGFLAAWDGGSVRPTTSTVNFAAGTDTANMAIVPVGPCLSCGASTGLPSITVINGSSGMVNVIVDVVGFYDDGQVVDTTGIPLDGMRFKPLTPTRIVDTRLRQGTTTFTGTSSKKVSVPASVVGPDTYMLVTNTTAVLPTMSAYLTLWADWGFGSPMPTVSNLNAPKGSIVANATVTDLAPTFDANFNTIGNEFSIYNSRGTTNVAVDVMGTMEYPMPPLLLALRSTAVAPRVWKSRAIAGPVR